MCRGAGYPDQGIVPLFCHASVKIPAQAEQRASITSKSAGAIELAEATVCGSSAIQGGRFMG